MIKKVSFLSALAFLSIGTAAAAPTIVAEHFNVTATVAAKQIHQQLAARHFKVIDNLDVTADLKKHAPRLAAMIPAKIQAERVLVACNGPAMVGFLRTDAFATSLCPISISLVQENGKTTAYYLERSAIRSSAAAGKLDREVLASLHAAQAMRAKMSKK